MTEEEALIEQVAKVMYGIGPNDEWGKVFDIQKVSYRRKARTFLEVAVALQNIKAVFPEVEVISEAYTKIVNTKPL